MTAAQDGSSAIQLAAHRPLHLSQWMTGFAPAITLGLAHGVSDCTVGFLIGGLALGASPAQAGWLALAYNGLAFGGQPLAGWLADRSRRYREMLLVGLALGVMALLSFSLQPALAIGLAGLGSTALHAAGGGLAIQATPGRASGPGWFAAPGVFGLALGGLLAAQGSQAAWPLALALAAAGALAAIIPLPQLSKIPGPTAPAFTEWLVALLILALALRSTLWTGLHLQAEGQPGVFMQLALAAALGKALGGMLADWVSWRRWIFAALAPAAALLVIYEIADTGVLTLLAGVFFLQSITSPLLAALGLAMPGQPGLAASLGLGLAVILGGLPALTGWSAMPSAPRAMLLVLIMIGGLAWYSFRLGITTR